ncbi:bifunctional folylpolyglutamate synthase/dihydrofolate synthase [Streptococcus ruminicola]|uniref:bifunctional folylpolyglutamate synthase/dihydrofolate synthase n=1 Tax=Streptococcus ruminicola TaxID=2686210 RepID=UPI0012F78601|nr:folylpolyglutamate synthase/dihydrofolate synthase family protein [Streptococcus ruminicola]QGX00809.1 bifunctional folylpolyglutamate synthase/dihydrofolate synthase [Streptococcus ruminicola]
MTYIDTLNWIHSHKANGRRPSLERMRHLLNLLDNPQNKFPAVHIVGTNGKGSTTSFLQHILTASGYKTGTFTSPFITRFNERIAIDSKEISDSDLVKTAQAIKPIVDSNDFQEKVGKVTEFELVTALMFYYFATINPVDVAVIEAGIGGTFDSTNVFTAKAVICPSISIDHQETLGKTLTEIADHKAGVLNPHVPFIFGQMTPEVQKVFHQKAKELDCPTYELDKEFSIRENGESFDFHYKDISISNITLSMLGHHQRTNASLAAMAAIILKSYFKNITKATIKNGLENTVWAGRCELMRPNLMLDGAHNEDSIAKLVDVLKKDFSNRNIHILFAGLGRKPLTQMLEELSAYDLAVTSFDFYQAQALSDYPEKYTKVFDYRDWLKRVEQNPEDFFVVTGSLYFISEVRNFLLNQ